jgi:hypothetical protein
MTVSVLVVATGFRKPALTETVVNYTFHVPANVQTNPCVVGEVVNLNGDIHIVIITTASGGGYRVIII